MKRIIYCILLCLVTMTGCGSTSITEPNDEFFTVISRCRNYNIVYCTETKVMYTISNSAYNSGDITLLVNTDGTPMIYEEKKE